MGSTYKRNGIWYVDLRVKGRRVRKKAGKSKTLAELLLKDLELKAERNQLGFLEHKETPLEGFVKEFLEYSKANHRESTVKRYKSSLDNFLTFIKKKTNIKLLSDITPQTIEKYKTYRKTVKVAKNGTKSKNTKMGTVKEGAKSYTINFEIMTLKTMFNLAVKWRKLEKSPATGVKSLKVEDSKPRRFLTEGESRLLLEEAPKECYPIFFTFLATGMRRAELVNLEWDDVNLKNRIIKIQRKSFWKPKTGEREIPINPELMVVLNKLHKKGNFVFTDKTGGQINADWIREQLVKTAKKAGIKKLTEVHALRHTFASQLNKLKVDAPTIQKLMGHSSIETTMIYVHQTTDQLRDAVKKLDFAPKPDKETTVKIA